MVSENLAATGSGQRLKIGSTGQRNGVTSNGCALLGACRCCARLGYAGCDSIDCGHDIGGKCRPAEWDHLGPKQRNNGNALSGSGNGNSAKLAEKRNSVIGNKVNIDKRNGVNNRRISSSRQCEALWLHGNSWNKCVRRQQQQGDEKTKEEARSGLLLEIDASSASHSIIATRPSLAQNIGSPGGRLQSVTGSEPLASPPLRASHFVNSVNRAPAKPEATGEEDDVIKRRVTRPTASAETGTREMGRELGSSFSLIKDRDKSKDLNNQAQSSCRQNAHHHHCYCHRWPRHKPSRTTTTLLSVRLAVMLLLLVSLGGHLGATARYKNLLAAKRVSRQTSTANNWRANGAAGSHHLQTNSANNNQQNVPYKTFYVTRACEWKSNLFVPKSNDIHFAQAASSSQQLLSPGNFDQRQAESSVAYETLGTANNNANGNYARATSGGQFQQLDASNGPGKTMLSTDSKALILALPIVMSQSFAGYEPACSIRLIVPRNMRILAKLTSRRLTFDQQQFEEGQADTLDANYNEASSLGINQQPPQQQPPSLWLNVSQNQFIETEHRIIETEGNILAFRFLLERFANKQVPDTRFQVVLTAFQTLSENSDLNGASQSPANSRPSLEPNAQFICDQQRLISANLACDGFKNCQDGHDEEPATCLSLRASQTPDLGDPSGAHGSGTQLTEQPPVRDQTFNGENGVVVIDQQPGAARGAGSDHESFWARLWHYVRDTHSLAGFFVGFLLVLALLTCCSCCTYLVYMLYRHQWRPFRDRQRRRDLAEGQEADHLAASQNSENAARQLAGQTLSLDTGNKPPPRLQSILKRPLEPPPAVPERQGRGSKAAATGSMAAAGSAYDGSQKPRGALSSSISRGQVRGADLPQFRPTPAQRLTRPTRPVPLPQLSQQTTESWLSRSSPGSTKQPAPAATASSATFGQPQHHQQTGSQSTTAPGGAGTITTSVTGTQRITTYHYSSGTTRLSESYIQKLIAEQQQQQSQMRQSTSTGAATSAAATPSGEPNVNYRRDLSSVSPQSSLI